MRQSLDAFSIQPDSYRLPGNGSNGVAIRTAKSATVATGCATAPSGSRPPDRTKRDMLTGAAYPGKIAPAPYDATQ